MRVPLEVLLLVPLPAWRALFVAHGAGRPKTLADVRVAPASAPPGLDRAARTLASLGDDGARSAVLEAARELGVDTADWPKGAGTSELRYNQMNGDAVSGFGSGWRLEVPSIEVSSEPGLPYAGR
jgi:hypothetical protein